MSTDALTWLREVEKAMTPGKWSTYRGQNGVIRMPPAGVLWNVMGDNPNNDVDNTGIVALRNLFPAALAVVEAAQQFQTSWDGCLKIADLDVPTVGRLREALDAFTAAVREEQERHG